MKKAINLLVFLTLLLSVTLITGCSNSDVDSADKTIGLGETFVFDDLEITLENNLSFDTIKNEWSEHNGQEVVRVPVTIKNLKDETHSLNIFYYSIFGSQGTQIGSATSYFDDGIDEAGDLRSGASYTKAFYFLYDGDGTYTIEFDDVWGPKTTVQFNVAK